MFERQHIVADGGRQFLLHELAYRLAELQLTGRLG
jgi:hypothetical protein